MIHTIPGRDDLRIDTIILDLNGTLSVGGVLVAGVEHRITMLTQMGYKIVLFTGNTRGDAADICRELGLTWQQAKTADEKRLLALSLNAATCASIGNGRIDTAMMEVVGLSILTLQAEGVFAPLLSTVDIVVPTILDALDLFIDSQRLIATLRS